MHAVRPLLLGLLLLCGVQAQAQEPVWEPTDGPGGGSVALLTGDSDGNLYAQVESVRGWGFYRSTNQAESWAKLPISSRVRAFAEDLSGVRYAGTDGGLLRSTDGGLTWAPVPGIDEGIMVLKTAPNGTLLAGTTDGLYRFRPAEASWAQVAAPGLIVSALDVRPNGEAAAVTKYFKNSQGESEALLLRSTDQGEAWTATTSPSILPLDVALHPDGSVYLVTYNFLWRIQADGAIADTLRLSDDPLYTNRWIDITDDGTFYVGSGGRCYPEECYPPSGFFRSTDGGEQWTLFGPSRYASSALYRAPDGTLYAGTDGFGIDAGTLPDAGILRSTDGGLTWTERNHGIRLGTTTALAQGPDAAVLAMNRYRLYASHDQGRSWSVAFAPSAPHFIRQVVTCADAVTYVLMYTYAPDSVENTTPFVRSEDGLQTWVPTDLPNDATSEIVCMSGGQLLLNTYYGLYLASIDRTTWQLIEREAPSEPFQRLVPGHDGHLFGIIRVTAQDHRLYESVDGGKTWARISPEGLDARLLAVVSNDEVLAGKRALNHRLTRTDDTWGLKALDPPHVTVFQNARSPSTIFVAEGTAHTASHDGVFRLLPGARAWQPLAEGWPDRMAATGVIVGRDGHLYAGTEGRSVWRSSQPVATATEDPPEVPARVALGPNYPNPFNPTTTIPFTLAAPSRVTLVVYDVLGREVARLVEAEQRAAGQHTIAWDATGHASGIYLYKLIAGGAVQARHMLLLK